MAAFGYRNETEEETRFRVRQEQVSAAIAVAVAAEREACARLAIEGAERSAYNTPSHRLMAEEIAAAIRSRK